MAIMHYNGDVRIIDIILDHIGEVINETVFNHYGKKVKPLDMLLNHRRLHLMGNLIGRVINLDGTLAEPRRDIRKKYNPYVWAANF